MNDEQIKEMCNDIYEGGDWEPMIDYITNLQQENKKLNNRINNCAEEILKEINKNNHLSMGVALAIRQKLIDYREIKGGK